MPQQALIVGASRGLGLGLVREYLTRGWDVIGTSRGPSALDALATEAAGRLRVEPLEVTDDAAVDALYARLGAAKLDLLFVNAGVALNVGTPLGAMRPEAFTALMLINTRAPLHILERFADRVTPGGAMAAMSSGLGSVGNNNGGGWDGYRASKAALNTALKSFAGRHRGATVLALAPGWVRTDLGGARASLDVETSVRGLADVVADHAGSGRCAFLDYRGKTVPW